MRLFIFIVFMLATVHLSAQVHKQPPALRAPLVAASDTIVVAGRQYAASALHRLLFGDLHRTPWLQPVRVPVLDLERSAGGLTPLRAGGGFQTRSLRFQGGDGRQYKFRSMDKYPIGLLPEELRNTFVADVLQDFISTAHPYAAMVAAPILDGCGVLNAAPQLVVLPDDVRLDSFRTAYARRFGFLELHPDEGARDDAAFAGSEKVVGTFSLLEKLQSSTKHRVDARAYLKARLLDIFMGDWDRHTDQWRWARFGNARVDFWQPIPRDRDQAFCVYDGLIPWIVTIVIPQIESCDARYPQLQYLTYSGRHLDRRFLTALDWPVWSNVVGELLSALDDSLLHAATHSLPPIVDTTTGRHSEPPERARMTALLHDRRAGLAAAARAWYALLNREAELFCSDEDELVEITRHDGGDVTVRARAMKPGKRTSDEAVFFHRRFSAATTDEIRIHLDGGDDRCIVRGHADNAIELRIIGGEGHDSFIDSAHVHACARGFLPLRIHARANHFYDDGHDTEIMRGPSSALDRTRVPVPGTPEERYEPVLRDWGAEWIPTLMGAWNADLGILAGGGARFTRYGFRHDPYAWRFDLRAGIAPMSSLGTVELAADVRNVIPGAAVLLEAGINGYEVINYFGAGNGSRPSNDPSISHAVKQTQVFVRPRVTIPLLPHLETDLGAAVRLVTSDLDDEQLYLGIITPFGSLPTALTDVHATLRWDTRDRAAWPTRGFLLHLEGRFFPGLLDLPTAFTRASANASMYFSSHYPFPCTLALRAGGQRLWGSYPYFESAFLGGLASARGYEMNRFAGDAVVHGGMELRFPLIRTQVILPTEIGMFGFVERGRVFLEGEESRDWHDSWGGGLWFAPVSRDATVSASIGVAAGHIRFDVAAGFAF
ncbi:MAG: BamA/TamA family outer membrane protein [Bacteroidota bacterium]|jgi:hypothetical protein|nr:BamA/TamA family outer membrane protein [Bacteroidota bacterium]